MRFKKQVKPGDILKLEVQIIKRKGKVGIGSVIATVNNILVAKGELTFVITE